MKDSSHNYLTSTEAICLLIPFVGQYLFEKIFCPFLLCGFTNIWQVIFENIMLIEYCKGLLFVINIFQVQPWRIIALVLLYDPNEDFKNMTEIQYFSKMLSYSSIHKLMTQRQVF